MKQIKTLFLSLIISFGAYSQETEIVIPSDNDSKLIYIEEKAGEHYNYNIKGQLLDGKKSGEWTWSYKNGNTYFKANFIENKKYDKLTVFDTQGNVVINYDSQNSNQKKFSEDQEGLLNRISQEISQYYYVDKEAIALKEKSKYYYPNGQPFASCSFDGTFTTFSEKGNFMMKGKLIPKISSEKIDTSQILYSYIQVRNSNSGNPEKFFELVEPYGNISNTEICFLKENLPTMKCKYYWDGEIIYYNFQDGKIDKRSLYTKGIPNNDFDFIYGVTGNLIKKVSYSEKCHVIDSTWYENGNLKTVINLIGDKKNGPYLEFDINGKILTKKYFTLNKKDGIWYQYFESGKIMGKTGFKLGQNDGEFIVYFEDGRIRFKAVYKDGKRLGNITYNDGTKQTIITDETKQWQIEGEMGVELRKYYESKK
jgi:antitoxin component YwqK of YwqJK toxin-antitoxin module